MSTHQNPKPAGWQVGEKFTAAQCTAINLNAVNSVDNTVAGDTVLGPLTFDGAAAGITFTSAATNGITLNSGSGITCRAGANASFLGAVATGASTTFTYASGCHVSYLAGSVLNIPSTCNATVSIGSGNTFVVATGATCAMGLNASSSITLAGGTLVSTLAGGDIVFGGGAYQQRVWPVVPQSFPSNWSPSNDGLGAQGGGVSATQSIFVPLWDLRNGASFTLVQAKIYIAPGNHSAIPNVMPQFQLWRRPMGPGVAITPTRLFTNAIQFPRPNSGLVSDYESSVIQQWSSNGAPNTGAVIDTTQFVYWIELVAENGTNAVSLGNLFTAIEIHFSVPDMRL